MSYRSLLKHRCTLLRVREVLVGGLAGAEWETVATNVRCYLDLNFIRRGKDPIWTPESGRASVRSGVIFIHPDYSEDVLSGMRVAMTRGPSGVFQIEGAVDQAWTPTKLHHLECGVEEVSSPLAQGAL